MPYRIAHLSRSLMRSPMFTAVTVLTIGIGVGANTAIFSVIDGILLRPLPYADAERLVSVSQSAPSLNLPNMNLSPSDYFTFREENRVFQEFGVWQSGTASVTGLAAPEQVNSLSVTQGTLEALGVQPVLGRWFTAADESAGSPETTILTYGYWQRRFGGSASAIGRRMVVDGKAVEIVGAMPRSFRFLDGKPDLFFPFQFDRAKITLGGFGFEGIARLKPGATLAQANADVTRMIPIVNAKFPPPPGISAKLFEDVRILPSVRPLKQDVVGDLGKVLWVMMASIGAVLLIACANVANLMLVRAEGRRQEFAVRAALGAGSGSIAGELIAESVLLGVLGGVAGLGLAYGALRLLVAIAPAYLPRIENVALGPLGVVFTLAVSLTAGVLLGLIPAIRYAAPNITAALRAGGRTSSQSREAHKARNALVVAQVALAVVLLIASGLMIRSFQALRNVHPGFSAPREIQTLSVSIAEAQVKEPERVVRMFQEIQGKLAAIPGVASVSFANSIPTDGNDSFDPVGAEDRTYREGELPPLRRFKFVAPGFFQAMGTRLVAGRDVTWTDLYDRRPVALISDNMAREMWRTPSAAIGKRIKTSPADPWREIVGVTEDVRHDGSDRKAPATVYWPMLMDHFWGNPTIVQRKAVFAIRSSRAGSESFLKEVRQAVWSVDSDAPLVGVNTMEEVYRGSMARSSFALVMLAIAGGMALLLGIVGIYGVISYSVSQRTREIGIRIALGAQPKTLRAMVVRQGLALALVGVALGLAGAAAATRMMSSLLFGIGPVDPLTYCIVGAGLLAAAAAASYAPAHRASGVDPNEALRAE
jgi:putative ABC transport system permease protein